MMATTPCPLPSDYDEPCRHAEGADVSVLPRIFDSDINMAILRRRLPLDVEAGARAQCQADKALSVSWLGPPGDGLRGELEHHLHDLPTSAPLIEDILTLADAMAFLFDTASVGLRLRCLEAAMCPRFHCDNLPVRLVTTYSGPGSEWLPERAVNRQGLGAPKPGKPDIVTDPSAIQQVNTGDIALLKGSGWVGNEQHPLVHRSPELAVGQRRLLLTIDPA